MKILGRLTRILGTLLKRFLNLLNFITQFRDSTSSDTAGARDGAEDEFSLRNFCRAFLQWAALPNFHNILAIPSLTLSLPQSQSPFTTVSVQINQLSGRAHTQLDYDSSWCNSTYGWHGKVLFNRHELDFQKVLSPKSFKQFVDVCYIDLHSGKFAENTLNLVVDEQDITRNQSPSDPPLVYRIRIVCQEGAICRNGIDINMVVTTWGM